MKAKNTCLAAFCFFAAILSSPANALIITEVFNHPSGAANTGTNDAGCAGKAQSTSNQFVEIYNDTDAPVDLSGYTLSDGASTDTLIAWSNAFNGPLNGITILNASSTILPARSFALILDPDYGKCD